MIIRSNLRLVVRIQEDKRTILVRHLQATTFSRCFRQSATLMLHAAIRVRCWKSDACS